MKKSKRILRHRDGLHQQRIVSTGARKYKILHGTLGEVFSVTVDDVSVSPALTVSANNYLIFLGTPPASATIIRVIY